MGEDTRAIEQQIEDTRERMGDTVAALSHKADVPGRVKESVSDRKQAVMASRLLRTQQTRRRVQPRRLVRSTRRSCATRLRKPSAAESSAFLVKLQGRLRAPWGVGVRRRPLPTRKSVRRH